MTNDDIDRIRDNMRERGINTRDIDGIVALARRGLRAEREVCGTCKDLGPGVKNGFYCFTVDRPVRPEYFCDWWRAKEGA